MAVLTILEESPKVGFPLTNRLSVTGLGERAISRCVSQDACAALPYLDRGPAYVYAVTSGGF